VKKREPLARAQRRRERERERERTEREMAILLLILVLVVSLLFIVLRRRRQESCEVGVAAGPREPPWVEHWLPYVGSAVAFGRDSIRFMRACQEHHGDVFRLRLMGQDYTFVLDPFSFPRIFREEKKHVSSAAIIAEFSCRIFGFDPAQLPQYDYNVTHR